MIDAGIFPAPFGRPPSVCISPASPEAIGGARLQGLLSTGGTVSAAWPSANLALFYPFSVSKPCIAVKMWLLNGTTAAGNFDLGIYDASGTRLVSSGTTAQSGTSQIQVVDTTDLGLVPGVQYYMALSMDGTTATTRAYTIAGTGRYAAMGMAQMATAFVLPSSATYALDSTAYLPWFGLSRLVTV